MKYLTQEVIPQREPTNKYLSKNLPRIFASFKQIVYGKVEKNQANLLVALMQEPVTQRKPTDKHDSAILGGFHM